MRGLFHNARTFQAVLLGGAIAATFLSGLPSTARAGPLPQLSPADLFAGPLLARKQVHKHKRGKLRKDTDRDGLSDWTELRRTRTNPRHRDTDRDRLSDWTEVRRTHTNPRRRDTDGDGLSDWFELRHSKTNPRRADSDGDGIRDRDEIRAGSDPRDPASIPSPTLTAPPLFPAPSPAPTPAPGGGGDDGPADPPPPPDTTSPAVQVTSGPDGFTNNASPTFGFSAEAGAALACSIDNGDPDFGPCSGTGSHGPAEPLGDGSHTFRVRAMDEAGKQAIATRGFDLDATEPETQIDAAPPSLTDNHSASFEFSGADPGGSGIASFECRVDPSAPGDWTPCTSALELTDLSDGLHAFEVRAIDQAGNVDASPATYEWTVDTTPPAVEVTSGPDGLTNNASPNFGFSAEAGVSVQCSIDAGSADFGPCSDVDSHGSAEPLGDGVHTFRVRASDAAGNQAVVTRDFEVDTAPPPAPVLSATEPGSPANHNEPLLLGEAQAGTTVQLHVGGGCTGTPLDTVGAAQLEAGVEVSVEDDSTTVFRATATTAAGNTSGCSEPLMYVEDSSAPQTEIDSGPAALTNEPDAELAFSGEDGSGSGVASFECRVDSESAGAWEACSSGIELTGLSEGQHKFEVRAIDNAGNADQSAATHEWQIDLTAPQVTIDSLSKALLKAGETSEAAWHADENGAFELRVGGSDCETGTVIDSGPYAGQPAQQNSEVAAADLAEGANTLRLCLTDAAGNRGEGTATLSKDTTAPETQIDSGPPALTDNADATLSFSGEDGAGSGVASFECRIDSSAPGDWSPCTLPRGLTDLDDGSHTFEVRAIDFAGNADGSPATHTWTVDTTPPAVEVTSGPDGLTNDDSPTFGFSTESGSTVLCSIDAGSPEFGPCSGANSHSAAEPLADGTHTFRVQATDPADNQAVATREFDVDATEPETQIDATPPSLTDSDSASFEFSGADPDGSGVASFECRIDSSSPGAWSPCVSGIELTELGQGAHSFEVRAIDLAGNTDPTPAAYGWSTDTVAPTTQIDAAPPGLTGSPDATFEFSGADPGGSGIASFECRIDSGSPEAWSPCTSALELTDLDDGPHSFEVRAIDLAGNVDATPAIHEWTVDTTPPTVQVTSGPDGLTNNASPSFGFDAEAGATVQCSIDAGSADFGPCSGANSHSAAEPLADGVHIFRVRATDAAGNLAIATRDFEVDTALPPAPVLSATEPGSPANHNEPLLLGEAQAGTTVQLYVGGGCSGEPLDSFGAAQLEIGVEVSVADDSTSVFRATATTEAGNTSGCSEPLMYVEDSSAPQTEIDSGPAALTNEPNAELAFSGEDGSGSGVASFECRVDSEEIGDWTPCTSALELTDLSDDLHRFEVRAIDQAGNVDATPAAHEWTVDTTPPAVEVTSGPDGLTNNASPSFGFSAEEGATVECSIDEGTADFAPCSGADTHTPAEPLADGTHTFRARATDAADNQTVAMRAFKLDATAPETQIDSGPPSLADSDSASFEFSGVDPGGSGIASFECRVDSGGPGAWASCSSPSELNDLDDGPHTFEVRAIDQAGNTDATPAGLDWTVDTTPPAVQVDTGPAGLTNNPSPTFGFSSEPGADFECSIDEGSADFGPCSGAASHAPASPLAEGPHTFRVRATDAAANQATATRSFTVDTTAPDAPQLSATDPASPANDNTPELIGSAPADTTVTLYADDDCAGSAVAAVAAAELEDGIEVSVADNSTSTFSATATTAAENTSGCSEPLSYVEDSTAPTTQIDQGPAALVNATTATFEFSGSDPAGSGVATFECKLDDDPFAACESDIELTDLAEGAHKFEVRAIDNAGNADQSAAAHEWQIDLTAPQVTIDSLSKALLKAGETSEVAWHADENGAFELRAGGSDCETGTVIDSGPYAGQPAQQNSEVAAADLAEGANTLRLCLSDAAGNRGEGTAAIVKDTTAPQTLITLKPETPMNSTTAKFEFAGSDPGGSGVASFQCRRDGGAWSICSSPREYTALAEGAHSFEARAIDLAGNTDPSPADFDWQIDLTPPAVQVDSGPDGLTNNPSPTFAFSSEPGASFECSIDEGTPGFGPCSGAGSHTPAGPLAEGAHTFRVRATDAATNQAVATRDFEVDTTAPPTPVLTSTVPASPANDNEPQVFGNALTGATVQIFTGGDCSGSPAATLSPAELEAGFPISVPDDSTTVFRATVTSAERNSGCSEPLVYVEDSSPPETSIASAPPATTLSTSASFFPVSDEPGSSFECSLDGVAFTACDSPRSYADLTAQEHSFAVRATDAAGNLDPTPAEWAWTVEAPPPVPSACAGNGTEVTTAAAVRSAVQAGDNVCVTADVGDVNLGNLGPRPVVISTAGGSMGDVDLGSTSELTISKARFRSTVLRHSDRVSLLENTIGGTPSSRVDDQLIFMPDSSADVAIEGNDLGWTVADSSGNTGYGCRCYGDLDRLRFVGNTIHDVAADGFQGVGGVDVLIDRNEIGPVGRNPESNEHSDNIQITGNEANLRITNNWIHDQGYYDGEVTANAGSTYIHGGSTGSLLYANNLIETAQGRTEICGLGTGGTTRSNITIRRNTWVDGGLAFNGFPGFEWDCDAGSGNTITRNIAVDPDGGFADHGYDEAIVAPNLFGEPSSVSLDADGNCTSANCNPDGEEPIGYRKPAGVSW